MIIVLLTCYDRSEKVGLFLRLYGNKVDSLTNDPTIGCCLVPCHFNLDKRVARSFAIVSSEALKS